MTEPSTEIHGLFPLDLVLLPGERIPLHIFEPRYRALVADCVLTASEFVLPLVRGDSVTEVACAARIESLIRRFSDGRMNVVVAGTRRVRITSAAEERPYLTGLVEDLPDDREDVDHTLERRVTDRFDDLVAQIAGGRLDVSRSDAPRSYAIAGQIQLEAVLKQTLLEERSENTRLAVVDEILVRALDQIDRPDEGARRSGSNGDPTVSE